MELDKLNPYLNITIAKFQDFFHREEFCFSLFKGEGEEEIEAKIDRVGRFIIKLFSLDDRELMDACFRIGKLHHAKGIPFARLFTGFNFIKVNLYFLLAEDNKLDYFFESLEKIFSKITNYIAKGYIDLILDEFVQHFSNVIVKNDIINYHKEWIEKLLSSAKKRAAFDMEKCDVEEWIKSDEFKLMCVDHYICNEIKSTHEALHSYGKAFYKFYVENNYFEALLVFKTLIMLSYKFIGDLQTTFTKFTTEREVNFFKLAERISGEEPFILVVFNPENLKVINKMYGVEAGNKILDVIEETLRNVFSGYSTLVVRSTSGEVFFLVRNDGKDLLDVVAQVKWKIENREIEKVGILPKIGVAVVDVRKKLSSEMIRWLINYAQRKAVNTENKMFVLKDKDIDEQLLSKARQEREKVELISNAIKYKKIDVFFQPIVDLESKRIVHYEVLARILDKGKVIPAGVFIDMVYAFNLSVELDSAVLERILFYAPQLKNVVKTLFINLSSKSLESRFFVSKLKLFLEAMKEFGIDVIFELTEQAILESTDRIIQIHDTLGITFAVDDFGTGYSSIKSVIELSSKGVISHIKIDGSLVKHIAVSSESERVVSVITAMAEALGLTTVAEFVENEPILEKLKQMGVTLGQGYHFSKPLPVSHLSNK